MAALRIFLAAWLAFAAQSVYAQSGDEIRLAFWNIQWFPGGRPEATEQEKQTQAEVVLPEVEKLNPDIMGMMEINGNLAAMLAVSKLSSFKVDVCSGFLDPSSNEMTFQQVAIASKLNPISAWWETWKQTGVKDVRRGFAFAAFEPRPGNVLLVYAVHLKSNRGELLENMENREETMRQLLEHVAAMEAAYQNMGPVTVVVGGDFNTSADDPRFSHETTLRKIASAGFKWAWENVPFSKRVTIPSKPTSSYPDACFDHVFVKNAEIVSAAPSETPLAASDHRPVSAVIRLPAAKVQ